MTARNDGGAAHKDYAMTIENSSDPSAPRQLMRDVWLIVAPILAVGLLALSMGIVAGAFSAGKFGFGFWVALGLAAAVFAGTVWMIRRILPAYKLPRSPRMRRSRLALYASGGIGIVIGALIILIQPGEPDAVLDMLQGRNPLPLPIVALLFAGLAASLVLSVRWHRLLDEHERAAYDFGAVAAIYAYFFLSIGWWLLWRAALVPAPDGIAIFASVMMTWMVGWLIRRFR